MRRLLPAALLPAALLTAACISPSEGPPLPVSAVDFGAVAASGQGAGKVELPEPGSLAVLRLDCPHCTGETVAGTVSAGDWTSMLRADGAYTGARLINLAAEVTDDVRVASDRGEWTVTVMPVSDLPAASSVTGTGDGVVRVTPEVVRITHHGDGDVRATAVDTQGQTVTLLHGRGRMAQTVEVPATGLIEIRADAPWEIAPA